VKKKTKKKSITRKKSNKLKKTVKKAPKVKKQKISFPLVFLLLILFVVVFLVILNLATIVGKYSAVVDEGQFSMEIVECIPESNEEYCFRLGMNCGTVMDYDNCGSYRTVTCGFCDDDAICYNNVCQ
jgi:hypothetical protein